MSWCAALANLLGKGPEDYASKKNEFFSRAAKVNLELDAWRWG